MEPVHALAPPLADVPAEPPLLWYEASVLLLGPDGVVEDALRILDKRGEVTVLDVDRLPRVVAARPYSGAPDRILALVAREAVATSAIAPHPWDLVANLRSADAISAVVDNLAKRGLYDPDARIDNVLRALGFFFAVCIYLLVDPALVVCFGVAFTLVCVFVRHPRPTALGLLVVKQARASAARSAELAVVFADARPGWLTPPCCG